MPRLEKENMGLPLADESIQLIVREAIKEIGHADMRIVTINKICNNLTTFESAQLQHCSTLLRMVVETLQSYDVPF